MLSQTKTLSVKKSAFWYLKFWLHFSVLAYKYSLRIVTFKKQHMNLNKEHSSKI